MNSLVRWLLRLCFRFRAVNESVLESPGPVLLIPNHVSWIDFILIGVCLDRDWKFVSSSTTAETSWIHRKIMLGPRAFPVDTMSPYSVRSVARYLRAGGRLVLFAEGRISTTGHLMKLFEGTGFLLFKTDAKVITAHLEGAERLRCTKHRGWKRWFPRITVHFSSPMTPPKLSCGSTLVARRRYTDWLYNQMIEQRFDTRFASAPASVLEAIALAARDQPGKVIVQDVTQRSLTYRRLLTGTALLADQWRTRITAPDHGRVGVLLPNVNATPTVGPSLWAAGYVPTILNFSAGMPTTAVCCRLAGIKQIITSSAFLEKAKLDLTPLKEAGAELLILENIRPGISSSRKISALLKTCLGFYPQSPIPAGDGTAVILFTSGSEGAPKGVELTHRNLLANIHQMLAMIDITDDDRLFNTLPLFHSFGLTIGTLLPLIRGIHTFLYPSPLHYRVVPTALYNLNSTILLGTNTFLNGYARKAHPYDFHHLRYLFAGAEKVQASTFDTWARRYGIRILEGYGATECGPCISGNTKMRPRFGSAGRFLPGIEYRLEPVEGVENGGRLWVKGPNVMRGYLNREAHLAFRALKGWYDTGDVVEIDDDGYLHIRGRLKRFAKISGEMVSLTAVEDALAGRFTHYGLRCEAAILSRPDHDRGERLIAVVNDRRIDLAQIRTVIRDQGMTNLFVPREVLTVDEIPKLGTGKVDHRKLRELVAPQLEAD